MPQVTTWTASGQGTIDLNSGGIQRIAEIDVVIVTMADYATIVGVSPYRRVWHQGWYGLSLVVDAGPLDGYDILTWGKYIETESEVHLLEPLPYATTLVWDLKPGAVCYFEVDW